MMALRKIVILRRPRSGRLEERTALFQPCRYSCPASPPTPRASAQWRFGRASRQAHRDLEDAGGAVAAGLDKIVGAAGRGAGIAFAAAGRAAAAVIAAGAALRRRTVGERPLRRDVGRTATAAAAAADRLRQRRHVLAGAAGAA